MLMTAAARITDNRANGHQSTGPRIRQGETIVARNLRQRGRPAEGQFCGTKPIAAGSVEQQTLCGSGVTSDPASDRPEETNPISPGARGTSLWSVDLGPGPEGQPAAEGQFCETKPIGVGSAEQQTLCSTGVMSDPASSRPERTNPISAKAPGAGLWSVDLGPGPDGQPAAAGQFCGTKPIGAR